ncbi:PPE family protein [Mycobacterium intracellulare]|uniref:PPE family protein n=1 Tax=Mycobacterium intracellulare TaxID=1767 RepID=UPI001925DDCE|nr:PPE family protein [Mycobacterium intracellulare]MCA2275518.1 PPE family protein [Mycobacterium intracellulare]MCA2324478.1 PPE family protein [Mycobacterium intracellulare]BCP29621.1 PPE family protein [Mycobacterium intracellulare]
MDFWLLPPEINSARMYAGAGSGPFLAAADAWDAICAELAEAGAGFRSTLVGLAAVWRGPSADAMTASGLVYTAWLTSTASRAATSANQARAAVTAYEVARAATVHPAAVAANRQQLAVLVGSNLLGQNTAAIMALEAAYAEMWAQDIAAMAEYQAASLAATTQLPQFGPPSQVSHLGANPQDAAMGRAGSVLSLLNPNDVPIFGLDNGSLLGQYLQSFLSSGPYDVPIALLSMFNVLWAFTPASPITQAFNRLSAAAEATAPAAAPAVAVSSVRAAFGTAQRLGPLSAPRQWWAQPANAAVPPAPTVRPVAPGEIPIPIPLPAPMPVARGGTPTKQQRPEPEYGGIVRFVTRPPCGG